MSKVSFGGVSGELRNLNIEEVMDEVRNDDGELIYMSKKTYFHDEGEKSFSYKYAVSALDMYNCTGDEDEKGKVYMEIKLVVVPDSLHSSCIESIKRCNGWEGEDDCGISPYDVLEYGYGIVMEKDTIHVLVDDDGYVVDEDASDLLDTKEVSDKLQFAIDILDGINGMRGFALDRAWNMVGTTGWDTINECLTGKCAIQNTISRRNA